MVNLNIYDKVGASCDKTWIDPMYQCLYSREIEKYSAYTIVRRYNKSYKGYDYYLVLSNTPDNNHVWNSVFVTNDGIIKIRLSHIWNNLPYSKKNKQFDVPISQVDKDENEVVYYLDI